MEALLSAVASDLIGRLVSFLIGNCLDHGVTDATVRLQRALLRARAVVEEAEGRQMGNRAMLLQLDQLRGAMCRSYYALDAFRRRAVDRNTRSRAVATSSFSFRLSPRGGNTAADGLAAVARSLEATLSDMKEFVVLLGCCPRLNRQPYSAYLFMESCMFGRQMEKEQIIGFLLQQPAQDLEVIPIIGPHEVGKRTLVEHVCLDERVQQHFSKIHHLRSDDLDPPSWSLLDPTTRSLIVVDFAGGDAYDYEEEEAWRRFNSSMRRRGHSESKIILISRTERHACLGTMPPLQLRAPRPEELWYFFRALAFGAADPEERPDLLRLAMAMCGGIRDGDESVFASANVLAAALRADLSARSWRRVLRVSAGATKLDLGGALPGRRDRPVEKTWYYLVLDLGGGLPGRRDLGARSMQVKDVSGASIRIYDKRKSTGLAQDELPKVTMAGLLTRGGAVLPGGETRFDVLMWQSRVPPFASYVATCDIIGDITRLPAAGEKRVRKRRGQHDDHRNEST
ncbi:hypothetical protein ACP4OV_020516 [Aristida adscensionis]